MIPFLLLFFIADVHADLIFKMKKITLNQTELLVEVADNPELSSQGLMFRTSLKDGEGMIFIFPRSQELGFWMKNTLIPLSIGYFDEKGILFQITDMEPASPMDQKPKTYSSIKPGKYALEVPKGWFVRKNIKLGAKLKL